MSKYKNPDFIAALESILVQMSVGKLSQLSFQERERVVAEACKAMYKDKPMDDYAVETDKDRQNHARMEDEEEATKALTEGYIQTTANRIGKGIVNTAGAAVVGGAAAAVATGGNPIGTMMGAGAASMLAGSLSAIRVIVGLFSDLRNMSILKDEAKVDALIKEIEDKAKDIDALSLMQKTRLRNALRDKARYFSDLSSGKNEEIQSNADRVRQAINSVVSKINQAQSVNEDLQDLVLEAYCDNPSHSLDNYEVVTQDDRVSKRDTNFLRADTEEEDKWLRTDDNFDKGDSEKINFIAKPKTKENLAEAAEYTADIDRKLVELHSIYYRMRDLVQYKTEVSDGYVNSIVSKANAYKKGMSDLSRDGNLSQIERHNVEELIRTCNYILFNADHLNTGMVRKDYSPYVKTEDVGMDYRVITDQDRRHDERVEAAEKDGAMEAILGSSADVQPKPLFLPKENNIVPESSHEVRPGITFFKKG